MAEDPVETRAHTCPDPETVAAAVDGALPPVERAQLEAHLAACGDCYEMFSDAMRFKLDEEAAAPAPPARHGVRRPRRWFYAGGGLAVAASVAFLLMLQPAWVQRLTAPPSSRPELVELVAAVGADRRTEGRLTGGFAWGPPPSPDRNGTPDAGLSPDVQIAVARLQQAVERERSAAALAAYGSASLVAGRLHDAVEALEESTDRDPAAAGVWADLSAAYLARSRLPGGGIDVPRALEAAEAALRHDPALPEARFNRALALERLGLKPDAAQAWEAYLELDGDSPWADEARTRVSALSAPVSGRFDGQPLRDRLLGGVLPAWGTAYLSNDAAAAAQALDEAAAMVDALEAAPADRLAAEAVDSVRLALRTGPSAVHALAEAHAAYGRGIRAIRDDGYENSRPHFVAAEASFRRGASPVALMAAYQRGIVLYRQRAFAEAETLFTALASASTGRYPSLLGRVEWMRGLLAAERGDQRAALSRYADARTEFAAAHESQNVANVDGLFATSYDRLGDPVASWQARLHALGATAGDGALLATANAALRLEWFAVAVALQDAVAARSTRTAVIADALRNRAVTLVLAGRQAEARVSIDRARELTPRIEDPDARDRMDAEVDVADALVSAAEGRDGRAAADRALAFFGRPETAARLPPLYLARARMTRAAGDEAAARHDLQRALGVYEDLRSGLPADDAQATFTDTVRDVLIELTEIDVAAGRPARALAAVDTVRGAEYRAAAAPPVADGAPMPRGTVALQYLVGRQRTYVWAREGDETYFAEVTAPRRELARLVAAVTPPRFDRQASRRLRELLIGPFESVLESADLLVVVADGPLHRLSFAALPGRRHAFLIQEQAVLISPSVRSWQAWQARRVILAPPRSALAIGNPSFSRDAFPALPDLPAADAEAAAVASGYPEPALLRRGDATRQRIVDRLGRTDVVHVAGHALVNDWAPAASMLVVGDAGITAREIRHLDLSATQLVVLAACRSAGSAVADTEGPLGLARAFLVAGSPTVVASRWPLSDASSLPLMLEFHRVFRETGDPARALQRAQVQALRTASSVNPFAWSGLVVIGAGRTAAGNQETY